MKPFQTLALTTFTLALSANTAWAYNFGFARAPDWMDVYLISMLVALIPFAIAVAITKPKSVAMKELFQRQSELSRTALYYYRICQIIAIPMLLMLMVGMGLARM